MKLARIGLHLVGLSLVGCATAPTLGETEAASTVNDYNGSTGCSTAVVLGLGTQIAEEAACIDPNSFVQIADSANITYTSNAVLPFLVKGAADDLASEAVGHTLQINSALRTIPQQYLLLHWFNLGRCGITAAAAVGHSNHEGGRAVDLANWSDRLQSMPAHGWAHDVPGDPVHFDHTSSPDNRGQDVLAFQRLWNTNNPNDKISEDGDYGPQTEARLKKSPATGFAIGPSCGTTSHAAASTVAVDGPDHIMSGATAHYAFTLVNNSQTDWPDTTEVDVSSGLASQLADASWVSPTEILTLGHTVQAGDQVVIEFDVHAPTVTQETPIAEPLVLRDNGAEIGRINLGVTVTMTDDGGASSEGSDPDPSGVTEGGCSAGGGGAGLLVGLAFFGIRRRRRA